MRQLKVLLLVLLTIFSSKICYSQFQTQDWNSIVDLKKEQNEKAKSIEEFLKERQSQIGNVSNLLVVVDPFGRPYDSAKFRYPKFFGDLEPKYLPKDVVVFLEEKVITPTQRFYFYNGGLTLVYCYEKQVTVLINGVKQTNRETKLETHIKHDGHWIMVASSGTFIQDPK
ncbi:MAG TPA: hypothetical protein VGK59_12050 [Ohtaekwangia sp.]